VRVVYAIENGPINLSSFGGSMIPFDIRRADNRVLRGGRTDKAARGCTVFISRTYRARFGFAGTTVMGWIVALSFTEFTGDAVRAARFAALAAWYLAFDRVSFDCSLGPDGFLEGFATDQLLGR
jgi:hypothetical protein